MMFTTNLFAQNTDPEIHYYYIEEANHDLLKPTKIIENANEIITLYVRDSTIEHVFH